MGAEDTRCDGSRSVAASGSAEVVECELRRPAVEDGQSRLVEWRDLGQSQAISRSRNVQCGALCGCGRPGIADRGEAGGRLRLAETEDARSVVMRRCAVWSVATQGSRLVDWKVTTCG
jgi:hypothetical protein